MVLCLSLINIQDLHLNLQIFRPAIKGFDALAFDVLVFYLLAQDRINYKPDFAQGSGSLECAAGAEPWTLRDKPSGCKG